MRSKKLWSRCRSTQSEIWFQNLVRQKIFWIRVRENSEADWKNNIQIVWWSEFGIWKDVPGVEFSCSEQYIALE